MAVVVRRPRCAGLHLAGLVVSATGLPEQRILTLFDPMPIDSVTGGISIGLKPRLARAVGRVRAGLRHSVPARFSTGEPNGFHHCGIGRRTEFGVFWCCCCLHGLVVIRSLWIALAQTSYGRLWPARSRLLCLRDRQYGHGGGYSSCGWRAAAICRLWRHLRCHTRRWFRYPPLSPEDHLSMKRIGTVCAKGGLRWRRLLMPLFSVVW